MEQLRRSTCSKQKEAVADKSAESSRVVSNRTVVADSVTVDGFEIAKMDTIADGAARVRPLCPHDDQVPRPSPDSSWSCENLSR